MISSRHLARAALPRVARPARLPRSQPPFRFQSTSSASSATRGPSSAASVAGSSSSSLAVGAAGGLAGALLLYGLQSLTPAGQLQRKINKTAKEVDKKYQAAAKKLQEKTPSPDEAVDAMRQFAYSYVAWVPGGRAYVDTAFADFDAVRRNHGEEADQIINDTYKQLQDVAKAGLSFAALERAYEALAELSKKLAGLTASAFADVADNHPELKEKLGGNAEQLKRLGDQYGPEAKKLVDDTWRQIQDLVAGGLGAGSLEKARRLLSEKLEQVKKLGDEAWKKALEEAQPLLDKNPKIKEFVEKNADTLKQGNAKDVFDRVRSAVESGDLGELNKYVEDAVGKAKSKGSELAGGSGSSDGWGQYLKMVPNADDVVAKLQQLREVAEKHRDEGEKLVKETAEEIKQLLEKKVKKAEEIVNKAKKEAK